MMVGDLFNVLLYSLVFLIYGTICIFAIIFTFSLNTYSKIHEALNIEIFSNPILSPIEKSIDWFDAWAMKNNKTLGPLIVVFSLIDIKLFINLINSFK